jgi:hypothetical protein
VHLPGFRFIHKIYLIRQLDYKRREAINKEPGHYEYAKILIDAKIHQVLHTFFLLCHHQVALYFVNAFSPEPIRMGKGLLSVWLKWIIAALCQATKSSPFLILA